MNSAPFVRALKTSFAEPALPPTSTSFPSFVIARSLTLLQRSLEFRALELLPVVQVRKNVRRRIYPEQTFGTADGNPLSCPEPIKTFPCPANRREDLAPGPEWLHERWHRLRAGSRQQWRADEVPRPVSA